MYANESLCLYLRIDLKYVMKYLCLGVDEKCRVRVIRKEGQRLATIEEEEELINDKLLNKGTREKNKERAKGM